MMMRLVLVALAAATAHASIASPHPYQEKQPDGSTVTLKIHGDEEFHYESDVEGFPVVREKASGEYRYAEQKTKGGRLTPTPYVVGKPVPASAFLSRGVVPPPKERLEASRRLFADEAAPPTYVETRKAALRNKQHFTGATETLKNLLIPIRFSDHVDRDLPTREEMDVIMNCDCVDGSNPLAPTGSVKDVFLVSSHGQLSVETTTVDWVTLPNTEAYYANGDSGDTWDYMNEMITDGLDAAQAAGADFSDFDVDGDGYIDGIAFLHSGYGAEWGGTDAYGQPQGNRIWAHMWYIDPWTSNDGVKVEMYHISPALWDTSGSEIGRVGVIAHETGHFLGWPDYYDYGAGQGLGSWDLMANSWGFDGSQYYPPAVSARLKEEAGWVTPTVLTPGAAATVVDVAPAYDTAVAYKIFLGDDSREYLLIENRQSMGFDGAIPQSGLAIWHVDETHNSGSAGGVPGEGAWPQDHYYIALQQADGDYALERGNSQGDAGDTFHADGVDAMGPLGTSAGRPYPRTIAYIDGVEVETGVSITNIGPSPANQVSSVAFTLSGNGPAPTPFPTPFPTPRPTALPTVFPTPRPTPAPTPRPSTPGPTVVPGNPSATPVAAPTPAPTTRPTRFPSPRPTGAPTAVDSSCQVSDWSEWGTCEYKTSCSQCAYGQGGPNSWDRPGGAPAAQRFPEARAGRMNVRKMAAKAAAWAASGDDPAWRHVDDRGCDWIAKKPERCFTKAGAANACKATCGRAATIGAETSVAGACVDGVADGFQFPCDGVDLKAWVDMGQMAGCSGMTNMNWGWTSEGGEEWALVGCASGTAFVRVGASTSDAFLPTQTSSSTWRDVKTYGRYALVGSEASGHGMQIFDLERLGTDGATSSMQPDAHYGGFGSSHNIVVNEEAGMAYGVGTGTCSGGLHAISMADPLEPVYVGCAWDGDYVHDAQCVVYRGPDTEHYGKEICFLYSENEIRIVDVTASAEPIQLASLDYGAVYYAHQGWINCEHTALFVDDELDEKNSGDSNTKTYVIDVRDLDDPRVLTVHESHLTSIDHNQYVCGAYLYQANYEAGLRILDASKVLADTDPSTAAWERREASCVYGHNMDVADADRGTSILEGLSVAECKARCAATAGCQAIEYGADHGGSSPDYAAGDCQLQSAAFSYETCDGGFYNLDLYTFVVPGYNEIEEVASFDTYPASTSTGWNGAWNVYPFFESGTVVANAIGAGVAFVDPSSLQIQTRTRSVTANAGGATCPLLVQERSCDTSPTSAPVPAPTPRPSLSFAPTRYCDCGYAAGVHVITDAYPAESSWTFNGGGDYGCPGLDESATFAQGDHDHGVVEIGGLCAGETYTFTMSDSYGDGICCGYGAGSVSLSVQGNEVLQASDFGLSVAHTFTMDGTAATAAPTEEEVLSAPTAAPTEECADDSGWRYKGKSGKDCNWVTKKFEKKGYDDGECKKKCKKWKDNTGGAKVKAKDGCCASCEEYF